MQLIVTGDLHCTDKTPESRIDNYPAEQFNKISSILKATKDLYPILQPGDFTDTPFLSYLYWRKLCSYFRESTIYAVRGQHDMKYRNIGNTPLDALETALDDFHIVRKPIHLGENVYLYGASFEENIPKITTTGFNILLIHRMIVGSYEQEWEKDKGYDLAAQFLQKHKFDAIFSGDNHKSFTVLNADTPETRHLINCGSLMRSKVDQIEHKPFYCVFDTKTRTYEKHFIPIKDWAEVFDIEKKLKTEKRNEKLEAFVEGLALHKEMGLNFADNLIEYEKANNIPLELVKIRRSCMT